MTKYKIVIIEDEPPILRDIKRKVEASGDYFEVAGTAYDGVEALSLIKRIEPDLVITDIHIPLVDGLTLAEQVLNLYPDIIIVFISGYQEFEYARKAMKLHVEDYLIKPITYEAMGKLLYKIKTHIDETVEKNKREYLLTVLTMEEARPLSTLVIDTNEYFVLSFCFGPYSTGLVNLIYADNVFQNDDEIERFFNQRLTPNEKCWLFAGNFTNEKIAIISVNQTNKAHIVNIGKRFYWRKPWNK